MHFMPQDTLPDDMLCLPSSVLVWFDVNVIHENQFDGNLYFDTCHKRGVRSIGLVHQSDEKFNTKWKKHHRRPGAYKMYDKVRTTFCRRRGRLTTYVLTCCIPRRRSSTAMSCPRKI